MELYCLIFFLSFWKKNPKLRVFLDVTHKNSGFVPNFLDFLSIFVNMWKVEFFAWVWIFPLSYHTEWSYFYFYWQDAGVETLPYLGLKRAWYRWPTRKRLGQGSRMDKCPCLPSPPTSSPLSLLSVTTLPCQSWESHCHQVCPLMQFLLFHPDPPSREDSISLLVRPLLTIVVLRLRSHTEITNTKPFRFFLCQGQERCWLNKER